MANAVSATESSESDRIPSLEEAIQELVSDNLEGEPSITRAYLFPHESEIRLVYIDPTTSPSPGNHVSPFYFGRNPRYGVHYRSAVALIRPEEDHRSILPEGWGDWDSAQVRYEKKQDHG